MNIFCFSLHHPVSVLAGYAALMLFGLIALFILPFEELPELDIPEYRIVTILSGFPPAEMENLVTIPLENALSGVQGIRESEAFTGTGISLIILRLDWGEDAQSTARQLRECVDLQYPLLPRNCGKPLVLTRSSARSPFMTLALEPAPSVDAERFHRIIDREFREELQKLEEISLAEFRGLRKSQISVRADLEALSIMGVSLSGCADALKSSLVSRNVGKVITAGREQLVKLEHPYHSARELTELRPFADRPLRLGEVADIRRELSERSSLFLLNGSEAVGLRLYKNGMIGTLAASQKIREILPELKESFSGELKITVLRDYGDPLRRSRQTLFSALLWGLAGAILVLILLYRSPVLPLITALSVPATLLPVFFILYVTDKGLNTLSLTGMIVGTGLIADSDIVVLEDLETSGNGSSYLFNALFSSALTTVIVFLPPLCLPGASGVLFRDLIITILLTVFFSLPAALLFTPALWKLCRRGRTARSAGSAGAGLSCLTGFYFRMLSRTMDRPGLSLILILLLPLIGFSSASLQPVNLLPSSFEAPLIIKAELPGDLSAEDIKARASQIGTDLAGKLPGRLICLESGRDESSLRDRGDPEASLHRLRISLESASGSNTGDRTSVFPSRQSRPIKEIETLLSGYPGLSRIRIEYESSIFASLLTPRRSIHFLEAESRKELAETGLPSGMTREYGTRSARLFFQEDRDAFDAAGVDRIKMTGELKALLEGVTAGEIESRGEMIKVILKGKEELKTDPAALSRIPIAAEADSVPLKNLGHFLFRSETSLLCRRNRRPCLRLIVTDCGFPGEIKPESSSRDEELSALPGLILTSLILLYLSLAMHSGSLKEALLLMICPLLATGGALFCLSLFTADLTLYAFMGILILQGTAVNTGILLVESFKARTGPPDRKRLQSIALNRLRPVMASTLTTAAALLPIIIGGMIRGDRQADTAIALTGGLLTSSLFIMLLLPPLYGYQHARKKSHGQDSQD